MIYLGVTRDCFKASIFTINSIKLFTYLQISIFITLMWYKKYLIYCLLISCFGFSQQKPPISYITEPVSTDHIDMSNFHLSRSEASTYSLLSLALPGFGSIKVSERDRGKNTMYTAVGLLVISVVSKVISNQAYNSYKEMGLADYEANTIAAKYDEANLANYVFVGSLSAYFTLGISDLLKSRKYAKKVIINRFD